MKRPNESLVDYYRGLKVLVSGGASFIGSALVELLLHSGARVTVADNLSSGLLANLDAVNNDIAFLRGDLRDRDFSMRAALGQQVVFHLAAAHGGRGYIDSHPVECTNNMLLDHVVFAAAASSGVEKLVYASSACVYPTHLQADERNRYLLRESDANFDEPGKAFADGEYGWAKLMGELQLRAFHQQYRMDGLACRIFTAYGERENETHAVIALIAKAIARLDPFPIWGNGLQTRNFTYVADTAFGMALAGARLADFHTINLGADKHHTINELVAEILQSLGWHPNDFHYQLDKPVGVGSRASDNSKIEQLLGWSPNTGLKEGLQRTIDWYKTVATPHRLSELKTRMVKRDAELQQVPD